MRNNKAQPPISVWRVLLVLLLVLGCVSFIWLNSTQSPAASSRRSEQMAEFLAQLVSRVLGSRSALIPFIRTHIRKIAHAVEFFALGLVAVVALLILRRVNVHMVLHAVLLVLSVAVADEAIQIFSGRGAQVQDVLLDFAGGMAGVLLPLFILMLWRLLFGHRQYEPEGE